MSLPLLEIIENFNKNLLSHSISVSEMMEMVSAAKNQVAQLRSESYFNQILEESNQEGDKYDLDELPLPRMRKIPRKLNDGCEMSSASTYFCS